MEDTVLGRLDHWARVQPEKKLFEFVDDHGRTTESLAYKDVFTRSTNLARWLIASPDTSSKGLGLTRGEKVLLVYPPGLDFIVTFLACLRAGVVAVPVYPPDPRKLRKDIIMFTSVCTSSGAKVALTNTTYGYAKKMLDIKQKVTFTEKYAWPELQWIETDSLTTTTPPNSSPLPPTLDEVAFLQYTSGSTSDPKGVIVSHGNLSHNLKLISTALRAADDSVVVSWLPQYHDMGLIGAYLGVLFTGGNGIYMSPFSFIKNPSLWIYLISQHRATHLQAPNFAFALCSRKYVEKDAIDLSSIRHMTNGAEPIDGDALDAFYRTFKPFGLQDGVIRPTYGLAEHTVYVCGSSPQLVRVHVEKSALEEENVFHEAAPGSPNTKEMVGCGSPLDINLRIVNPDTKQRVENGRVGEIWIESGSKTQGYYNMPSLTKEMFHATIIDESNDVEYVRTGDLGVIYREELFICGRLKDLVIVRGRNHYPQDIEKSVEGFNDTIRPGCSAAFSITHHGQEVLVIVAEIRGNEPSHTYDTIATQIRQAVTQEHGVRVDGLVFLPSHSIPKTTSGKISRRRTKQAFLSKTLKEVYRYENNSGDEEDVVEKDRDPTPKQDYPVFSSLPPQQVLDFLRGEMSQMLDLPASSISNSSTLHELGMDSMGLTQLQGIITNKYGLHVPEEILYGEGTTLEEIYHALIQARNAPHPNESGDNSTSFLQVETKPVTPKGRLCCGCIAIR